LPLLLALLCASAGATSRAQWSYAVTCESPGWRAVFSTFGLAELPWHAGGALPEADILVVCGGATVTREEHQAWQRDGRVTVLEGESSLAASFGFAASTGGTGAAPETVSVRNVKDLRAEELLIVWQKALPIRRTNLPRPARVLMEDRWSGAPLAAVLPVSQGNVFWLATGPGDSGYERFPLLANALAEAGFEAPLRTRTLWAFFDSAYRQRVDLDYLTARWERFGIAGLHISAWQHWEPAPEKDAWLRRLIEACHRRGILVYAWLEFPHVSERFWEQHPECREKTALGQDAQLDWRKLINLSDAACSAEIEKAAAGLLRRFSWDGVNLAEIYYESLEGAANPARFTPMNATIRESFQQEAGFDPAALFDSASPLHQSRNPAGLQRFLAWRRQRIAALHEQWLGFVASVQTELRDLHVVVTQIDDRFDASVRDSLGADSNALLPLMHKHPFTFLVEDPATIWHLGPSRYTEIARAYAQATPYPERLAVDINIFPRYQEVYPTKRQTGIELYRLVHAAARAFPRVALYFEHVLAQEDLPFLAASAAPAVQAVREGEQLRVNSAEAVGVRWRGPVRVNGRPWAAKDEDTVWLPRGQHTLEPGGEDPAVVLRHLSAELKHIHSAGRLLEFHYRSDTRAIATFDEPPARLWIDGTQIAAPVYEATRGYYLLLPPGEHLVGVEAAFGDQPSQ
jgi:hypothetical protein